MSLEHLCRARARLPTPAADVIRHGRCCATTNGTADADTTRALSADWPAGCMQTIIIRTAHCCGGVSHSTCQSRRAGYRPIVSAAAAAAPARECQSPARARPAHDRARPRDLPVAARLAACYLLLAACCLLPGLAGALSLTCCLATDAAARCSRPSSPGAPNEPASRWQCQRDR